MQSRAGDSYDRRVGQQFQETLQRLRGEATPADAEAASAARMAHLNRLQLHAWKVQLHRAEETDDQAAIAWLHQRISAAPAAN